MFLHCKNCSMYTHLCTLSFNICFWALISSPFQKISAKFFFCFDLNPNLSSGDHIYVTISLSTPQFIIMTTLNFFLFLTLISLTFIVFILAILSLIKLPAQALCLLHRACTGALTCGVHPHVCTYVQTMCKMVYADRIIVLFLTFN